MLLFVDLCCFLFICAVVCLIVLLFVDLCCCLFICDVVCLFVLLLCICVVVCVDAFRYSF